ncbi:efflux RND transporter periplasmic adaptor subunit [Seonamhaeicola sp. NFXS20]|uniref:efflux RND transporter periplasmic adaptor subunit n=1 Tax=unclassified Seonamhaeicola TaxID=2622645 RepID=UPI003566EFEB
MTQTYKLLTISFLLAVLGCKNSEKDSQNLANDNRIVISKEQFNANNMALGRLEKKTFPVSVKVNGIIDVPPENKATVNAITGGYIKSISLLVGDKVKKGQMLLSIENPEFIKMQQEYLEIKEQLNYLKSEYNRQNTMFKEHIISEKKYLKAESEFKSAVAKYNGLKKQLSLLNINPLKVEQGKTTSVSNIFAPINGSITNIFVSRGSYVTPSSPILEIIDNSHIHLELSVYEKDIMHIKKHQKIHFSIPENSNETYEAEVHLVGTSIDENRTIRVHAHPKDESQQFLTGMFVNAEIITHEITSSALPQNAVVEMENNHYLLVLDEVDEQNYYFIQTKVTVGKTHDGYTEIKSVNLENNNTQYLTNGAFSLIGI